METDESGEEFEDRCQCCKFSPGQVRFINVWLTYLDKLKMDISSTVQSIQYSQTKLCMLEYNNAGAYGGGGSSN